MFGRGQITGKVPGLTKITRLVQAPTWCWTHTTRPRKHRTLPLSTLPGSRLVEELREQLLTVSNEFVELENLISLFEGRMSLIASCCDEFYWILEAAGNNVSWIITLLDRLINSRSWLDLFPRLHVQFLALHEGNYSRLPDDRCNRNRRKEASSQHSHRTTR
jgi:hypothetical protein